MVTSNNKFRLNYGLFLLILLISTPTSAAANTVSDDSLNIESSFLDSTTIVIPDAETETINNSSNTNNPSQNSASDKLKDETTVNQTRINSTNNSNGYGIGIGSSIINYGEITPGEAILRTLNLTIKPTSDTRFTLFLFQDGNLRSNDSQVPLTRCDNGSCTGDIASIWQSPLTFGFGYRCDSKADLCSDDFSDENSYRTLGTGEANAKPFLQTQSLDKQTRAEVTIKINVAGTQIPGSYYNNLTFLLLPNL